MWLAGGIAIIVLVVAGVLIVSIKHKTLAINKGVFFLIVIAVGMIFYANNFESTNQNVAEIPKYQEIAPSITSAKYVVNTPSRIYYVSEYYEDEQYIVLTEYYSYDKKKWQVNEVPLYLDRSISDYSNLKVTSRT